MKFLLTQGFEFSCRA